MERAMLGQTKRLFIATAAAALAGCTGPGSSESDVPDSAALTVPGEPAAAPQPTPAESVTPAPGRTSGASPARPAQSEPVLIQPPPPRDTRPSIPWPPDTL